MALVMVYDYVGVLVVLVVWYHDCVWCYWLLFVGLILLCDLG